MAIYFPKGANLNINNIYNYKLLYYANIKIKML